MKMIYSVNTEASVQCARAENLVHRKILKLQKHKSLSFFSVALI